MFYREVSRFYCQEMFYREVSRFYCQESRFYRQVIRCYSRSGEQALLSEEQEEQVLLSCEQVLLSDEQEEQVLLSGEQVLLSGEQEEQVLLSGEQVLLSEEQVLPQRPWRQFRSGLRFFHRTVFTNKQADDNGRN